MSEHSPLYEQLKEFLLHETDKKEAASKLILDVVYILLDFYTLRDIIGVLETVKLAIFLAELMTPNEPPEEGLYV